VGHQVERPELVHTEDHLGLAGLGCHLVVGDGIEVLDPCLLGRVVRVAGGLPGLQALKGDAFLAEQDAQALVADVVDHPLGDQEVGELGQTPGRERQIVLGRPGLRDLGDLPSLGQGERPGPAAPVLRVQRVEAIGVEVVDHISDPIFTGERHLGDPGHRHALRGEQHHLGAAPGHHRAAAPADDPQQPPPFIVIELPYPYTLGHPHTLTEAYREQKHLARRVATQQGEPWLLRH